MRSLDKQIITILILNLDLIYIKYNIDILLGNKLFLQNLLNFLRQQSHKNKLHIIDVK